MICRAIFAKPAEYFILFCFSLLLTGCLGGGSSSDNADELLSFIDNGTNTANGNDSQTGDDNTNGDSQTDTSSLNTPPTASAGNDVGIIIGSEVTLSGSKSSDRDADLLMYNWSIVSKPENSDVTLDDTAGVVLTFTPDVTGEYMLMLIVNDGQDFSEPDTVNVFVSSINSMPIADAGLAQHVKTGDLVTLNGTGSSDQDADQLSYNWSFLSKPSGSQAVLNSSTEVNPSFTADVDGGYQLQLIVSDDATNSEPAEVEIVATTDNSLPVASAGVHQEVVTNTRVTLDGGQSSDADGDPLTYTWAFVFVPAGSQAELNDVNLVDPHFTPDLDGSYVISLVVSDGEVSSDIDSVVINAKSQNSVPIADAGTDLEIETGTLIGLDGSASYDANNDDLTYQWSFVTLPAGSSAVLDDDQSISPSFVADAAGSYLVQLLVSDGQSSSEADVILISAFDNTAPIADAGGNQQVGVNTPVSFDASASFDSDGDELSYQWKLLSTPANSFAELINDDSLTPSLTPDVAGSYVIELIVNDGVQRSLPDTVTVVATGVEPPSSSIVGYGANVTGGAGGEECIVTTLTDSSVSGTLRDCVSNRNLSGGDFVPRTIVFAVAGDIVLASDLSINTPHLTIDGSTAASPGITIKKSQVDKGMVRINTHRDHHAHNVILKHLRFQGSWSRSTEAHGQNHGVFTLDGEDQSSGVHDIVLDHITCVDSPDAAGDMWGKVYNVTVQNSFFHNNLHPMTMSHSGGDQPRYNITLYNNVFAHNHERNPQVRGRVYNLDIINNIIFDWGQFSGGGYGIRLRDRNGVYPTDVNAINNVFTSDDKQAYGLVYGTSLGTNYPGEVYSHGNYFDVTNDGSTSLSSSIIDTPDYADIEPRPLSELGNDVTSVGSHYKTDEEVSILTTIQETLESTVGID